MSQPVSTLGKYQIVNELGHGGFATVYQAHDPDLGLDVALKVLDSTLMRDRAFVDRFRTEARVAARLKHPNIARVYNIDQAEGRMFIAFEFISGGSLRDLLLAQPLLDWPRIGAIVQQVGEALDYAHAQQVLHRDVKPGNILLAENGAAVLTDFGLAKAAEGSHVTTTGLTVGTYAYIAPEQASSKDVDGRADLYALGVVAYEMCTGRVPFISDSTPALIHDQVYTPPPPPSQVNVRVAGPIETVLLKALAKDREQRYQSGAEFAAALRQAIEQVTGAHVSNLYREAQTLQQQGDLDGAEDKLRQVLAIQPDHAGAQTLVAQIVQQRDWQTRYQQLALAVKQAQQEATTLQQLQPAGKDTAGVLSLLTRQTPTPTPVTAPASVPVPTPIPDPQLAGKSPIRKRVLGGLAILAVMAIVAGIFIGRSVAFAPYMTGNNVYYVYQDQINNLKFGSLLIGLGLGSGAILLLTYLFRNKK